MNLEIKICNHCGRAAAGHLQCARCKAVSYCGTVCQRSDWREGGHKQLCAMMNVSEGGQLHHEDHSRIEELNEAIFQSVSSAPHHVQEMYRIFMSKDESDRALAQMKRLLNKEPMWARQMVLFQSLNILIQLPRRMAKLRTVCLI